MIDTITLSGKDYPVCFGMAALREVEKETGKDLAEVMNTLKKPKVTDVVYICWLGLKHGARHEGVDWAASEETVADLLDEPGKMTELSNLIGEQLGKIFAPAPPAKAKAGR